MPLKGARPVRWGRSEKVREKEIGHGRGGQSSGVLEAALPIVVLRFEVGVRGRGCEEGDLVHRLRAIAESVLGERDLVGDEVPRDPETALLIIVEELLVVLRERRESVALYLDQAYPPVLKVRPVIPALLIASFAAQMLLSPHPPR